ncbi:MAG: rhomboid family intramembrane serine protease [Verrucomicrobia bacterium]|nr:rhomboid family intramembrane serine protease [Verrucomicrobiota bacterium]
MSQSAFNSLNVSGRLLTPAVKYILGLTTLGLFLQHVLFRGYFYPAAGVSGVEIFGLSQAAFLQGQLWQFVTYTFLHENFIHFALNMLLVFFMGRDLEERFGRNAFVALYFASGALGGLGWLLIGGVGTNSGVCIGASGAAFGLIGAFAAAFPRREITVLVFFILPVTMSARVMALAAAGVSLLFMIISRSDVAHSAHLAGCVAGFGLTFVGMSLAPKRGSSRKNNRMQSRLRVLPYDEPEVELWQREPEPEPEPFTNAEVDTILEKIREKGLRSLSKRERRILDLASKGI